MFNRTSVTLDITDFDIRVAAFEGEKILKWVSKPLQEGLVKGGSIQDSQAVARIIDEVFRTSNLNRNRVICTLTGLPFIYRTISMPDTKSGQNAAAIARAGRKELSISEDEMYLFWHSTGVQSQVNEKDYLVVAVPKFQLDTLTQTLSRAKVNSPIIDIKALAMARASALKDAIIISLERGYFEIVLVENGLVRVIHSLNSEAPSDNKTAVVSDIIDGLSRAIKFFNRDYPQSQIPLETPIVLLGEWAANAEIVRLVKSISGHPAEVVRVPVQVPPEFPVSVFASNIGLMLKHKSASPAGLYYYNINLNLIPELKKTSNFHVSWSYTFLVAISLLMAVLVYKSYDMKTKEAENLKILEQSSARIAEQLTNSQAINETAQSAKQEKTAQLEKITTQSAQINTSIQSIQKQKRNYLQFVETLINSLPADCHYTAIELNQSELRFLGVTKEPGDVLAIKDYLENQTIFTNVRIAEIAPANEGCQFVLMLKMAN